MNDFESRYIKFSEEGFNLIKRHNLGERFINDITEKGDMPMARYDLQRTSLEYDAGTAQRACRKDYPQIGGANGGIYNPTRNGRQSWSSQ